MLGLLGLNLNMPKREVRAEVKEKVETRIENRIEKFKNTVAKLDNVKIIAVDSTTITVDNDGASVKVNISDNTQLRRKFWGKSELSEFSVGNMVNVMGKWTNEEKTEVNARMIRNLSIQKRYGTFFGEVKSISGDTFVINSIHREEQAVTIGSAKLINRKQEIINKTDILVGHKIRVKGLWDMSNKTVTEVREIKDFSLPIKPSPTP